VRHHLDPAELAALADGSLDPARRAELEALVASSPELAALLEEQRRSLALTRDAARETSVPDELRTRIDALRP
jgi:anti-sigma factor RsiW